MKIARISGIGHYVPELKVSNNDLSTMMDTNDEWIHSRTGIRNRHIAVTETSFEMAGYASLRALEKAELDPKNVELIIVATFSGEYATPSMACLVQKAIGASKAMCFDLNAACSGFVYGIDVADQFIKTGKYKNALVIGSEKLSQILDWEDRSTCVLFGDGAGAVILEANDEFGIIDSINYAIGEAFECLYAKNVGNKTPFYEEQNEHKLMMNGQDVFQFACKKVPEILYEMMAKNQITQEDVDYFVLHQANVRIVSKIAKRMKINMDKFYVNMEAYGNTSAASIPIALSEMSEEGLLTGKKVIIAGFGAGLTYGCSLIQF
ncbi:beta-ketoacyl-acyl carrier protein synthase III 1 [Petrocella atlantisensis]|uniref:Beta-ketoacyl-[acyl-carrier-protein] synthase III n=1 Tax=Petrocella atlantisensis TaxID=2173034 RepID=A0A3P7RYE9_9FIRM|nr:beta-ketoacyl-ACP synthase III [Petrocella atlantisensis]PKM54428.1 MAG: 3-oxoacyl-ACP synthase [Firmicutes bacterium HGW-Firmicutes-5]VDN47776.1 beta-ketoacyl-acyl carrier protein synthase III 1 [Petrocella atlantisensis]